MTKRRGEKSAGACLKYSRFYAKGAEAAAVWAWCVVGAHERVALWGEGERAVDPLPDACRLQDRIAAVNELELSGNAVDVLLQEFDAVIPGRPVHRPVLGLGFVDADQHPLLVLAHIGEPLEVHDHWQ